MYLEVVLVCKMGCWPSSVLQRRWSKRFFFEMGNVVFVWVGMVEPLKVKLSVISLAIFGGVPFELALNGVGCKLLQVNKFASLLIK